MFSSAFQEDRVGNHADFTRSKRNSVQPLAMVAMVVYAKFVRKVETKRHCWLRGFSRRICREAASKASLYYTYAEEKRFIFSQRTHVHKG